MYELDNKDIEILKNVEFFTNTEYETITVRNETKYIKKDILISAIEDLLSEVQSLHTEYENLQAELRDNYRVLPSKTIFESEE